MSYNYETQKSDLFTDEGQKMFLRIRDKTKYLVSRAGAVRVDKILQEAACTGDSWSMLACIDRMVELGELIEVTDPNTVAGQYRIFRETTP